MNKLLRILWMPVRYLPTTLRLAEYFDAQERRLVVMALIVGTAVWGVTYTLKTSVHWLEHTVLHGMAAGPIPLLIFVPLLLGSLLVALETAIQAESLAALNKGR